MIQRVTLEANPVFRPVHESKCRYVVMRGSAGSGKSMDTAQMYVLRLMMEPGRNLLCVRKTEESNRASTFAELSAAVSRLGVGGLWESTMAPLSMRCRLNGNAVLFRGLSDDRQRERLKSITFSSGKLTDVWIEEATELEANDLEIIDDRLRGRLPEGLFYQIKLTFNPVSANHWLKKRFFDRKSPDVLTNHSTYLDNRFIDREFHERMERRRVLDPEGYRVYGLGEWGVAGGQYFPEWRESVHICEEFRIPSHWRRYVTLDYGLDMLAAYFIAMDTSGNAWVYKEIYESGLIVSDAARLIRSRTQDGEGMLSVFCAPGSLEQAAGYGKIGGGDFRRKWRTVNARGERPRRRMV